MKMSPWWPGVCSAGVSLWWWLLIWQRLLGIHRGVWGEHPLPEVMCPTTFGMEAAKDGGIILRADLAPTLPPGPLQPCLPKIWL